MGVILGEKFCYFGKNGEKRGDGERIDKVLIANARVRG